MATLVDRLLTLADLHSQGMLTDAEFSQAKAKLLAEAPRETAPSPQPAPEQAPRPSPRPALNPTVTGVGLSLAAGGMALGG